MSRRVRRVPRVQQGLYRKLKIEQLSQMTDEVLFMNIVGRCYNIHAIEMVHRLVGQRQFNVDDGFLVKKVEKFIKDGFYLSYLEEALKRFKKRRKIAAPTVYIVDVDTVTEDNLRNKESDAEKAYNAWLKEVE